MLKHNRSSEHDGNNYTNQWNHPLTTHAGCRMKQRGCSSETIELAIDHGRVLFREGYEFRCVAARDVHGVMSPSSSERLRNLVVVTKDGKVITIYKNALGFHRVKCKRKRARRR